MSCSRSHSQEVADHPTALVCCFLCEAAPTALAQTEDSSFRLSLPLFLSIVLPVPHSSQASSLDHLAPTGFLQPLMSGWAWRGGRTVRALSPASRTPSLLPGLDKKMRSPPSLGQEGLGLMRGLRPKG